MKIDWRRKLTRRKLWVALAGFVSGLILAFGGGESTARAVQRIPDAHCNGDMHAALEYAVSIKHKQRDFLSEQGVHSTF